MWYKNGREVFLSQIQDRKDRSKETEFSIYLNRCGTLYYDEEVPYCTFFCHDPVGGFTTSEPVDFIYEKDSKSGILLIKVVTQNSIYTFDMGETRLK